jgi:FdrA protein
MLQAQVRPGAYYDSVVLMQLQRALLALPGVSEVGVVMGTPANKEILAQSGLTTAETEQAAQDDLVIVVSAATAAAATAALAQVDALLVAKRAGAAGGDYRPKSLAAAVRQLPEARWVLISVPGRYAAAVAGEALDLERNVFLYSDNVSLADETALKQKAAAKGLLVMGPDCGTAIVAGIGLGFANRVRPGPIGLVGASGTGLQHATARIHQLGSGITHALGTGGRDLSEQVGAITARQSLALLAADPATQVIMLISKPPAAAVAEQLLRQAQAAGKPVVVNFIGYKAGDTQLDNVYFAPTLDAAAQLAVELAAFEGQAVPAPAPAIFAPGQRYLRGLYSGGTLAAEAQAILVDYLPVVYANAPLQKQNKLESALVSRHHTIIDLGEDEFTVGRLHPMMDNDLRSKRLVQEADDPQTAVLLLDVVLGYGAHPDPAGELAPVIHQCIDRANRAGRRLHVVAVVVGTDEDPQGLGRQVEQLAAAGALVVFDHEAAVRRVGELLRTLAGYDGPTADAGLLHASPAAINVGLEFFSESLHAQGAAVVQVDWRPPAGGNEKLAGILARLKTR